MSADHDQTKKKKVSFLLVRLNATEIPDILLNLKQHTIQKVKDC